MKCLKHTKWDCKDHMVWPLKMFGSKFGKDVVSAKTFINIGKLFV
jgi:hypothetical protein